MFTDAEIPRIMEPPAHVVEFSQVKCDHRGQPKSKRMMNDQATGCLNQQVLSFSSFLLCIVKGLLSMSSFFLFARRAAGDDWSTALLTKTIGCLCSKNFSSPNRKVRENISENQLSPIRTDGQSLVGLDFIDWDNGMPEYQIYLVNVSPVTRDPREMLSAERVRSGAFALVMNVIFHGDSWSIISLSNEKDARAICPWRMNSFFLNRRSNLIFRRNRRTSNERVGSKDRMMIDLPFKQNNLWWRRHACR